MPDRQLRLPVRRLAAQLISTGHGPLRASSAAENGEMLEVLEHEDVTAILALQRDGTLAVRLFGDHGACPIRSALVRLETPSGASLTDQEARTNDEGRASLVISQQSTAPNTTDCYLIITLPVA